jgi:ATP-dependent Clp protease ATP-binding subunit ClpA
MTSQVRGRPASRELRAVFQEAVERVKRRGAGYVEAEDLLRAFAAVPGSAADLLAEAGLDADALDAALAAERAHGLASVGFAGDLPELDPAPRAVRPRWGASAHAIFGRIRHDGRVGPAAILVGILSADLGTVPRMLELAGVDRYQLLGRATSAAARERGR